MQTMVAATEKASDVSSGGGGRCRPVPQWWSGLHTKVVATEGTAHESYNNGGFGPIRALGVTTVVRFLVCVHGLHGEGFVYCAVVVWSVSQQSARELLGWHMAGRDFGVVSRVGRRLVP
ncbi:hypothetical protein BHE74_00036390 [Ensete ventricosum]|nr:hypothetical protein BHE74_00036390 [Ensete ventricosum]